MRRSLRGLVLGRTDSPQACDVELEHPQTEIAVSLLGLGEPRDVTSCHAIACITPFVVCIGFHPRETLGIEPGRRCELEFRERGDRKKLLGVIGLRVQEVSTLEGRTVVRFGAVSCRNYCIPVLRQVAHRLRYRIMERKDPKLRAQRIPEFMARCSAVGFIHPRPVVLVCFAEGPDGNVFPMNLLGDLGGGYFGFALNSERRPAPNVRRIGHVTLSTVPLAKEDVVRSLGGNHYRDAVPLDGLPFALRRSAEVGLPFPELARRVIELKVTTAEVLGSHWLFLAKIVAEARHSEGPEFHMIHGYYAAYRSLEAVENGVS